MKSLAISERYGWSRYVAHQVYYSLIGREYEWELMPLGSTKKWRAGLESARLGPPHRQRSAATAPSPKFRACTKPLNTARKSKTNIFTKSWT